MKPLSRFASVARQILIVEKVRPLREVAAALGMGYATLYARINGRAPFRPDEITRLIIEVPDQRLVDALLKETRFLAIRRLEEPSWGRAADAPMSAINAAQQVLGALLDILAGPTRGRLDIEARTHVEEHLHEAERAVARLRLAIGQLASAGPSVAADPLPTLNVPPRRAAALVATTAPVAASPAEK